MKVWNVTCKLVTPRGHVLFTGTSSFETDDRHCAKSAMRMFESVTWTRFKQDRAALIEANPGAKWQVWVQAEKTHKPEKSNNLPKKAGWTWKPWIYGALSGY